MSICPNLANPTIRKEFQKMSSVLGEDLAYYMWSENNGYPLDKDVKGKESSLYKDILNLTNNDHVKAMQYVAVSKTSSFKKYFTDFNKSNKNKLVEDLNINLKVFALNSYLEENNLEDIFSRLKTYKSFAKNIDENFDNNFINRIEKENKLSDEDRGRAIRWFSKSPLFNLKDEQGKPLISFTNLSNIVNSDAFAQWTKDGITLYKGSDFTNVYHEAFHGFTQKILNENQIDKLYATLRDRAGLSPLKNKDGNQIPYYALSRKQAEEVLAEEFRDFMIVKEEYKEEPKKTYFTKLFDKILNILKTLFGKREEIKKDFIQEFFNNLKNGNIITNRVKNKSEFAVLNLSKPYSVENFKDPDRLIKLDLGEAFLNNILENGIASINLNDNTTLEEGYYRITDNEYVYLFNKKDNTYNVYLIDQIREYTPDIVKEINEGVDVFIFENLRLNNKKITDLFGFNNESKELLNSSYNYALNSIKALYEKNRLLLENSEDEDFELSDKLFRQKRIIDHWETISKEHKKHFNKRLRVFESELDLDTEDSLSGNEEDLSREPGFSDKEIDPKDIAAPEVLALISSLPKLLKEVDSKGNKKIAESPLFGLPLTVDANVVWQSLISELQGSLNYTDIVNGIKNLIANGHTHFESLLKWIPDSEKNKTNNELKLSRAFVQTFSNPKLTSVALSIKKTGDKEFEMSVVDVNTTSWVKVKNKMDDDFVNNASRLFRKQNSLSEEPHLDVHAIVEKYGEFFSVNNINESANLPNKFNFLYEVTGLDLRNLGNSKEHTRLRNKGNAYANEIYKRVLLQRILQDSVNTPWFRKHSGNKKIVNYTNPLRKPIGGLTRIYNKKELAIINELIDTSFSWPYQKTVNGKKTAIPVENFKNDNEKLLSIYDTVFQLFGDHSYLSTENKLEYSIKQNNELLYLTTRLSKAESLDDLRNHPHTSHLVESTFSKYSLLMKKLFNRDGDKRTKQNGVQDDFIDITTLNYNGLNITSSNSSLNEGKKIPNMTSEDKFITDFLSFLKTGITENFRTGAKSQSLATVIKGGMNSREILNYEREDFETIGDNNERVITLPGEVQAQLMQYFLYELEMNEKNNEIKFIIFSDILTKDQQKDFQEKYNNFKGEKNVNNASFIRSVFDNNDFENAIEDFFIKTALKNTGTMLMKTLVPNFTEYEYDDLVKETFTTLKNLRGLPYYDYFEMQKDIVWFYSNYFTNSVELLHLFFSSPRNNQIKKGDYKEVFKRVGFVISPGRQALVNDDYIDSYNKNNSRKLAEVVLKNDKDFTPSKDITTFKDTLNMSISEDVPVHLGKDIVEIDGEKYIKPVLEYYKYNIAQEYAYKKKSISADELEKIAFEKAKSYASVNGSKEPDAQAWGNLDFFKFYLNSINRWTPSLDHLYEKEVRLLEVYLQYKNAKGKLKEDLFKDFLDIRESIVEASAQLPSLKLGLFGSAVGHPDSKTMGKFSVHILLPSVVIGTELENQMINMIKTGSDLHTFKSGSKLDFPAKMHKLYNEEGGIATINPLTEENLATFSIESLREQQYIAPKFKNKATLSTQFVKLLFGDFYDNGVFDNKEFNPEIEALVNRVREDFKNHLDNIINLEKIMLAEEMGVTLDDNNKVESINKNKFYQWLSKKAEGQNASLDFIEFADRMKNSENPQSLESVMYKRFADVMINAEVNKKLIKPSVSGEPYIQTASTGYGKKGTKLTNPSLEDLMKYGVNGLRGYRIENGKTQPAEVKIAFQPSKHKNLLNLFWKGEQILTLERLNKALLDENFVKENLDKISLMGVRIPVQGLNSMEYFVVKEFLPTSAGPIMIVPPEIVIKSGSDFDIDKLFMYEPTLNSKGELLSTNFDKQKAKNFKIKSRELNHKKSLLLEQLEEIQESFESLPEQDKVSLLKEEIAELQKEISNSIDYSDSNVTVIRKDINIDELEVLKNDLKSLETKRELLKNTHYNKLKFKLKASEAKVQAEDFISIHPINDEINLLRDKIALADVQEDIEEVSNLLEESRNKLNLYLLQLKELTNNKERIDLKEQQNVIKRLLAKIQNNLNLLEKESPKYMLKSQYNGLIKASIEILSNPSVYSSLITPLENVNVKPNVKEYTDALGVKFDAPLSGTSIFTPETSVKIHKDAIGGKAPLGVHAKMNALHRIYQQVGLQYESDQLNAYYLPSNRNSKGKISLGNKYLVNGDLVSAIQSELISAAVDIEKEDWIMRMGLDKVRSPFLQQMLLNGTSFLDSATFLTQPIINEYLRNSKRTLIQKVYYGNTNPDKEFVSLMESGLKVLGMPLSKAKTKKEKIQEYITSILKEEAALKFLNNFNFKNSFKNGYEPSDLFNNETRFSNAVSTEDKVYIYKQLVVLAQFKIVVEQNDALLELNSNLDFNTAKYSNMQDAYKVQNYINSLMDDTNASFNKEAIKQLISNSVISSFNATDFILDSVKPFYKITTSEKFQKYAMDKSKESYKEGDPEFVNTLADDFILSIYQNFGINENSGNLLIEDLKSIHFNPKLTNSLPDQFSKLKEMASTNKEVGKLFEQYPIFKHLSFRQAEELYYPVISGFSGKPEERDIYLYQLKDIVLSYQSIDEELTDFVTTFADMLINAVVLNMGLKIKMNTIQPFISESFYSHRIQQSLNDFEIVLNNDYLMDEYIKAFDSKITLSPQEQSQQTKDQVFFKDFTNMLSNDLKKQVMSEINKLKDLEIEEEQVEKDNECGTGV